MEMKQKQWSNIFHVVVNANSIVQHVVALIKNGVMININVSVKIIISAKKYIFGIQASEFVKKANI